MDWRIAVPFCSLLLLGFCGYPPRGEEVLPGSVLLPATRRGRYLANIVKRQAVDGTGIKFNEDADRMNAESKKKVDVLSEELLPYIIAEQERRTTLFRRIMTAIQNGEKGVTVAEVRNKHPLLIRRGLMYRCPSNRAIIEPDGSGIMMCENDVEPSPIMYDSCLSAEDKDVYVARNKFFFCNRHKVEGPDLPKNGSTVIGCAPSERTSLNYTYKKCALEETEDVVVQYRYYPDKTYKFVNDLDPDHEVCDHWNPCQVGYIFSLPSADQALPANELWHDYEEDDEAYERDETVPNDPDPDGSTADDFIDEFVHRDTESYRASPRRIKAAPVKNSSFWILCSKQPYLFGSSMYDKWRYEAPYYYTEFRRRSSHPETTYTLLQRETNNRYPIVTFGRTELVVHEISLNLALGQIGAVHTISFQGKGHRVKHVRVRAATWQVYNLHPTVCKIKHDDRGPISLATIIAKVLDSLLNKQLSRHLDLHDAQFGFRPSLSTESAILCLKQTVQYYTDRKTPVYACYLDLSKAFDLVSYNILWEKLSNETNLPPEIVSMFGYWYSNQKNSVKWAGAFSDVYRLECGVRQGGLSSPSLFNLYMNRLIEGLSSTKVGCHIDGVCINNISYADDMVLLTPSIAAMRKLLKICEEYAMAHGLKYNVSKSEFMIFKSRTKTYSSVPHLTLCGMPLKRVNSFKYLGHWVTDDLKDNVDIERERRALSVRCNMLARRFARCKDEVKITLFKAYCQSLYTCSLWVSFTQRAYSALRVQYNNAFRVLLGLPRFCSASTMFAEAHTDGFHAIIRKRSASLLERLRGSTNGILRALADRWDSPLLGRWLSLHVSSAMAGTIEINLGLMSKKSFGHYFAIVDSPEGVEEKIRIMQVHQAERDVLNHLKSTHVVTSFAVGEPAEATMTYDCPQCQLVNVLCNGADVLDNGHVVPEPPNTIKINYPSFEDSHSCVYKGVFKEGNQTYETLLAVIDNNSPDVTIPTFEKVDAPKENEPFEQAIKYQCAKTCNVEKVYANGIPLTSPTNAEELERNLVDPDQTSSPATFKVSSSAITIHIDKYSEEYDGQYQAVFSLDDGSTITKDIMEVINLNNTRRSAADNGRKYLTDANPSADHHITEEPIEGISGSRHVASTMANVADILTTRREELTILPSTNTIPTATSGNPTTILSFPTTVIDTTTPITTNVSSKP